MSAICIQGYSANSEVQAIADRFFQIIRLSVERSAAKINSKPNISIPNKMSIEKSAARFLDQYKKVNPNAVKNLAGISRGRNYRSVMPLSRLSGSSKEFDFSSPKTVFEQAVNMKMFADLKLSPKTVVGIKWNQNNTNYSIPLDKNLFARHIVDAMEFKQVNGGLQPGSTVASSTPPKKGKELHLKLDELKAIKRFGWELTDWGDDEMYCGGDGLDSTKQHIEVGRFFIHTFKKDGENYNINPNKTFVKFNLHQAGSWPRSFMANTFISEIDADGGFIKFLQELWDAIGADVARLATQLALTAMGGSAGAAIAAGAATGAAAGSIEPIIGTIVGAIIGAVIGLLVAWAIDSLKDDIFISSDNPLLAILDSPTALFDGNSTRSPTYTQEFTAKEAKYRMKYYWEIVY